MTKVPQPKILYAGFKEGEAKHIFKGLIGMYEKPFHQWFAKGMQAVNDKIIENAPDILNIDVIGWVVWNFKDEQIYYKTHELKPGDIFELPEGYRFEYDKDVKCEASTDSKCRIADGCNCYHKPALKIAKLVSINNPPDWPNGIVMDYGVQDEGVITLVKRCIKSDKGQITCFDLTMFQSLLPIINKQQNFEKFSLWQETPTTATDNTMPVEESQEQLWREFWRMMNTDNEVHKHFKIVRK